MSNQVFKVWKKTEYVKAGADDLIELRPTPGTNQIFVIKKTLEAFVYGIVSAEFIHLSGPTGSAKSSLIEALYKAPDNFKQVCRSIGVPFKPLQVFGIEMATYETPGELYQRRALNDGSTYDEASRLVLALQNSAAIINDNYVLIWLREMGRVHSSSVQGGLLNLMTKGNILLPDGNEIDGSGIAWVADSNYQAEQDSTHTLVTFDDALRRRFSMNITMNYLPLELEVNALQQILEEQKETYDKELVRKTVKLGQNVRRQRMEGNLQSITPPTIYGYLAFIKMVCALPHLNLQQIAECTMVGNASNEDKKLLPGLFNEVFGFAEFEEEDFSVTSNLF